MEILILNQVKLMKINGQRHFISRDARHWGKNALERGFVVGNVVSKIWGNHVINLLVEQHKLTERM